MRRNPRSVLGRSEHGRIRRGEPPIQVANPEQMIDASKRGRQSGQGDFARNERMAWYTTNKLSGRWQPFSRPPNCREGAALMKLLREPLVHFVMAAVVLFSVYAWLNQSRPA